MIASCPYRISTDLIFRCAACLFMATIVIAGEPESPWGYAPDRVIVKLTAADAVQARPGTNATRTISIERRMAELRGAVQPWNAQSVKTLWSTPFRDPARASQLGLDRYVTIEVPVGTDLKALIADLVKRPNLIEAVGLDAIGSVAELFPSDPDFPYQHNLHNTGIPLPPPPGNTCPSNPILCADADIDAPEAWDITTGHADVIVAVVDSGVFPHVEFGDRILPGWNTVSDSTDTSDGCPHGTHVAGIILAGGNNGSITCPAPGDPNHQCGIAGINWHAKLLPVKVLTGCTGNVLDVAAGIIWAADHGAHVINMSLQFYGLSGINLNVLQNAIDYANGLGVVIVAASGNNHVGGVGVVAYPARLPTVVAVSATNACDEIATFANAGWSSNYGPEVDLCAPGDDIYSTWTFDSYRCLFGTSMATPHVSGVASLIRSIAPALPPDAVVALMTGTADDVGPAGPDAFCGSGRVNAYLALVAAGLSCTTDAECNDGVFCNGVETCVNDTCVPGTPPDCDDAVDCTDDFCDANTDQCVTVADDAPCDDGVFCNGVEVCTVGTGCQAGSLPSCDDGIDCTEDSCNTAIDECVHEPDDSLCDDGDFCNGDEFCSAIADCQTGTPPSCDDGDGCTIDSCDQICRNDRVCGACCQAGGTCADLMTEAKCDATGLAHFLGVGSACMGDLDHDGFDDTCPLFIPTVSEWGLAILSLLLLVAAKIHFGHRLSPSSAAGQQ